MRRPVVLIALLALPACGRPAARVAPVAVALPAPTSAEAPHNWASVSAGRYLYYPAAHAEGGRDSARATTVSYLGRQADGAYVVTEGEGAMAMRASCLIPCAVARVEGQGLDHTGPLGGDSVTRAALDDAVQGRLEEYGAPPEGPAALHPRRE